MAVRLRTGHPPAKSNREMLLFVLQKHKLKIQSASSRRSSLCPLKEPHFSPVIFNIIMCFAIPRSVCFPIVFKGGGCVFSFPRCNDFHGNNIYSVSWTSRPMYAHIHFSVISTRNWGNWNFANPQIFMENLWLRWNKINQTKHFGGMKQISFAGVVFFNRFQCIHTHKLFSCQTDKMSGCLIYINGIYLPNKGKLYRYSMLMFW